MIPPLPPEVEIASADQANQFAKYVRVALLGEGGMGEVWKAWDRELHRWVALKFPRFEGREDLERLRQEAQSAGQLNHPNIAAVFEFGQAQGRHFIAMAYVDGQPLSTFSRKDRKKLVAFVRHAALAVASAHTQGVVHRDLKPDNIMIGRESEHVYVMDFGIARRTTATLTSTSAGTPPYMSPEQIQGRQIDGRSDVWSLGATLYELLADRPPFPGSSAGEVTRNILDVDPVGLRHVDHDLNTIVMKCLEKDAVRRYPTAQELADDLGRWARDEPINARPPSTVYRVGKWLSRHRVPVAGVLLGLLIATGATSYHLIRRFRELNARDRARPYLVAGQRDLERMRILMTQPDCRLNQLANLARTANGEFEKALEQYEVFPEAYLGIGNAWSLAERKKEALAWIEKAVALSPTFATAYLDRVRLKLPEFEELRHAQGGGIKDWTPNARALHAEIMEDLQKVESLSFDSVEKSYGKALLAFTEERYNDSQSLLGEFLARVPTDPDAHCWRGHALWHMGQREAERGDLKSAKRLYDEADTALSTALQFNTRHLEALGVRGNIYYDRNDHAAAIKNYDDVLRIKPESFVAYTNRGNTRRKMKDDDGALRDFDQALRIEPRYANALHMRGDLRLDTGRFADAIADYTRLLDLDPKYLVAHEVYANRADARAKTGDTAGALQDFSKVLETAPNDWEHREVIKREMEKLKR